MKPAHPVTAMTRLALAVSLLASCGYRDETRPLGLATSVRAHCQSPSSDVFFFPPGTFSTSEYDGAASRRRYSEALKRANEPSLSCGPQPDEGFRLVQVDRFELRVQIIGVTRRRRDATLSAQLLRRDTPGTSFEVVRTFVRSLNREQWSTFRSAFDQLDFWFTPSAPVRARQEFLLDPDVFILEGRRGSSYHVIWRAAPERGGVFVAACRPFFVAAGLEPPF